MNIITGVNIKTMGIVVVDTETDTNRIADARKTGMEMEAKNIRIRIQIRKIKIKIIANIESRVYQNHQKYQTNRKKEQNLNQ